MTGLPDHDKISVTARLVAYYRQFSDIPFAQEVAKAIGAEEAFKQVVQNNALSSDKLLEMAPILEARYKSIVSTLIKSGAEQVLELASGFSLRGFAMTGNLPITYIDTDLPALNTEKVKVVADLSENHHLARGASYRCHAANALDFDRLSQLIGPLPRDRKLAVVCEGLIQYFVPGEREILFQNVRRLLGEFEGGIWITPDLSTKDTTENVSSVRKKMREIVTGLTDRRLYESAFEDEADMNQFFSQMGFAPTVIRQLDEVTSLKSMEALSIRPQLLDHIKDRLKLWVLSPV